MSLMNDDTSLAPGFLVAAPELDGGPFEKAVILMVHHDAEGSMGFIVNKPVEIDFGSILQSARQEIGGEISGPSFEQEVWFGGPVRVEQLWVIYRDDGDGPVEYVASDFDEFDEVAEMSVGDAWVVAGSGTVIESFATGERDEPFFPVIGYSGWGAGQLEEEIEEGSWLAVDFDESLLLETDAADCWEAALATVGLDPASFMMMGKGGFA